MANKSYKNYKGELVTNCPKPEGTCLEPTHITKKQLMDMRKQGFDIPIYREQTLPKDVIAISKNLKNQKVGKTTVAGNPALEISLPELGNRKIYLVKDRGDEYSRPEVVVLFSDSEFDSDEAYNDQLKMYARNGRGDFPYTVVKSSKSELLFADEIVGGMIRFKDLEKSEGLRETYDEVLYGSEQIMFDADGKLISDTVLPNLPAKAKEWLVDNASYVEGEAPDEDEAFWDFFTSGEIVGKVEAL